MGKMKLRDVIIARAPVHVDEENYFEVRGIALADILRLSEKHMGAMVELFGQFMAKKGDGPITNEMMTEFLVDCIGDAQDLVKDVVALVADDDGDPDGQAADIFLHLRAPVQIEALMQVAALSITTEAELKKMVEGLTKIVQRVTALLGMTTLKRSQAAPVDDGEDFRFPNGVSAPVKESIS